MKAKLTARTVKGLEPRDKPFDVFDTETKGFLMRVEPSGTRTYYLAYRIDGKRRRYKIGRGGEGGLTPEQARDVARKASGQVAHGQDPQELRQQRRIEHAAAKVKTLGGFIEHKYTPWVMAERKGGQTTLQRLETNFGGYYDRPLSEITAWDLQKWRSDQIKDGKSKSTANRDVAALKAVFGKAVEWGALDYSPLHKLKQLKVDDDSRARYLTDDEEGRLMKALDDREDQARQGRASGNEWRAKRGYEPLPDIPPDYFADYLKPMTLLALNTGLRRGELFLLGWAKVNFSTKTLTVDGDKAKSGKTRHIPLNSTALAVLKQWQKQAAGDGLVFPGKEGKPMVSIKKAWAKLLEDAGVTDFRFHDTRHHFASQLVMAGVDLNTVRELLGHADLKMTLRYSHLAPEHKAAAVERIANGG